MSELKRKHGMGHLRVRGLARVVLAVTLKATACNVKRWLRQAATCRLSALLYAVWTTLNGRDRHAGDFFTPCQQRA